MTPKTYVPVLALTAAIAGLTASSAAADPSGTLASTSANWSGYVAGAPAGGSPLHFSSVSGSWVEPTPSCSGAQGYSSFWVGLGGTEGQQSPALEQVGTEADCDPTGATHHFAWYELVPAAPVHLNLTISPGDHISGRVTVSGASVTVSLSNTTSGASATKTLTMNNPDVSSAEWIAEAPSACDGNGCQPLALSNFGTVSFTQASATADGHTGNLNDPAWSTQPVQLGGGVSGYPAGLTSDQSSGQAAPSGVSADGYSFSVTTQTGAGTSGAGNPGAAGGYAGDGGYGSSSSGADGSGSGYGSSGSGSGSYGSGSGAYGYSGDGSGLGGYFYGGGI
jgi:Peptidase A4 family